MSCTKEEIERKRLAALQKRQSKLGTSNINSPLKFNGGSGLGGTQTRAGPLKSFGSNNHKNGYHPYSKSGSTSMAETSPTPVSKVVSGTVYLISENRFEVNPSEFCTPLISIFKTIPSKNYDAKSKLWNFSIDDYDLFMSKVSPLAPHIVLGTLPSYVLKVLRESRVDPHSIDLSPIEVTLRHKLMPFQEEGVRFAISRGGRCLLADDMGLGKTFQALAVASYYRHHWPLLVLTTSSMRETWQSKIHELLPSVPLMNIVTLATSKDAPLVADKQTEVVIVSYKIATTHEELLKNKKFGFVIIDESHSIKSHKARVTASVTAVSRRASRVLLLSGTPALSRPAELYTQLTLIQPNLFPSYTDYGKRYCNGKQTAFGWDMSGQSHAAELQVLLHKGFLIRRTKEQVLTELSGKTRETVLLDRSLLDLSAFNERELSQLADSVRSAGTKDKHSALITYFSQSATVKIPAVCKYIRDLVRDFPDKFLVFAHHRCVIDAVCTTLDELRVGYICIVGSTPGHTRADLVDTFQSSERCRCAVLSITAANAGITLTAATLVVFAELHWNPGIITQAESRAHRLGSAGAVSVRLLIAPHTADEYMWPLLRGKLDVLNNVGLSKESFENTTTKHQETKNPITNYITPAKNKNDYIPGTNIKINSMNNSEVKPSEESESEVKRSEESESKVQRSEDSECLERSFLEDTEDDELLANLG